MSQVNISLDLSEPVVLLSKKYATQEEWVKIRLQAKAIIARGFALFVSVLACGFLMLSMHVNADRERLLDRVIELNGTLQVSQRGLEAATHERDRLRQLSRFTPNGNIKWNLSLAEITAYTICDNPLFEDPQACDGITASGLAADYRLDIIAINPRDIPFHSDVWIKGVGWKQAKDKICHKNCRDISNSIDILMSTRREALKWGRQKYVPILVVPPRNLG